MDARELSGRGARIDGSEGGSHEQKPRSGWVRTYYWILPASGRRRLPMLLFLVIATGILETVAVAAIPIFVALLNSGGDLTQYGAFPLVERVQRSIGAHALLLYGSLGTGVFFLVKNVLLVAIYAYQSYFVVHQEGLAAERLLARYLTKPYTFHLNRNTAELLRNVQMETNRAFRGALWPALVLVSEVCVSVLILGLLLVLDPISSLIAGAVIGGAGALYYVLVRSRSYRWGQLQQFHNGQVIRWINQSLGAVKELKLRRKEQFFLNAFRRDMDGYVAAVAKNQIAVQGPRYLIETVAVLGLVSVVIVMVMGGGEVRAILPRLALFAAAAFRVMPSGTRIVHAATSMRQNQSALDVLSEELRETAAGRQLQEATERSDAAPPLRFTKAIELVDVEYDYPGSRERAVSGISLRIGRGESVAFVGASGSGKTTVVDLILGLLTPSSGTVRVDGVDIQERLSEWQRRLGYIPQHVYLYDDSVRHNVAFGIASADICDDRVWEVLEAAQIGQLVRRFPRGLDEPLGELGSRLSGGQRQRIGIARALYHDPPVLVLDEATAALDTATEREIMKTLDQFKGDRTLIFIAHRLSTVRDCEQLFVLSDGRVAASGTYDELLANSADFRRIAG